LAILVKPKGNQVEWQQIREVGFFILMLILSQAKAKKNFPECLSRGTRGRVVFSKKGEYSSPSAWDGALGEEEFFLKKIEFLPRVQHSGMRIFIKKDKFFPRVLHSGKRFFKKKSGRHRRHQIFPEC
jgi:hypothetical protein